MKPERDRSSGRVVVFPDWEEELAADSSLIPGLREAYRQAVRGFLALCHQRGSGATVALAREHVEVARLERAPSPGQVQEWKDALNWFFRRGRAAKEAARQGVPPLARADLGRTDWEAGLIRRVRERHFSWRTEQTYRAWLWRFARFPETGFSSG